MYQIRYQQQYQQIQSRIVPGSGSVGRYIDRDPATGLRMIETADGSRYLTQYISNSQPNGVMALAKAGEIGLSGYISQKPY